MRKRRHWQLLLCLFPTEDKMLLPFPKLLPLNLPTEPHPSWAASSIVFQLYSLALMPVLPKGHEHPSVCHREVLCGLCTIPKLLSSNTEPHHHFKQDYNPSKENQTNTNSAVEDQILKTSCLVRELRYTELEKESRNVWIVWVPKMLGRTLWKTNITGGTIPLVKPAGAVNL